MTADLFGSMEPAREEPRVLTVTELTRAVRATLEDEIGVVWVEGEISNYRKQPSGHQYFTLKDAGSQVSCVWFSRPGLRLKQVALADGMHVQLRGALTVYEARGQYQLNVQLVQAGGAGLLQAKFEALKRRLQEEGLFDAENKRPLPKFPAAIGIVTSPTGAALRDILNILGRRAPWVRVVINPVRVQGDGAAAEIAAAIEEFNRLPDLGLPPVDVILIGRGGGSVEDLWAFNEEIVARAIAGSSLPVVSAVGHEIDFTIADFVADLRAPTPSAAAELLVPDGAEFRQHLSRLAGQLRRCAVVQFQRSQERLDYLVRSRAFGAVQSRILEHAQRTDYLGETLRRLMREHMMKRRQQTAELLAKLRQHRPDQLLSIRRHQCEAISRRLQEVIRQKIQVDRQHLERWNELLRVLSPKATLARGYSITLLENGAVLRSVREAAPSAKLVTRLLDGEVRSSVESEQ